MAQQGRRVEPRPESLWVKVPARGMPDKYVVEGSCQPSPTLPTRLGDPRLSLQSWA